METCKVFAGVVWLYCRLPMEHDPLSGGGNAVMAFVER